MAEKLKKTIFIDSLQDAAIIYGSHDKYLRLIRDEFCADIIARDCEVKIEGDEDKVKAASGALEKLINIVKSTGRLSAKDVDGVIKEKKGRAQPNINEEETFIFQKKQVEDTESFWEVNNYNEASDNRISWRENLSTDTGNTGNNEEEGVVGPRIDVFSKRALVKAKTTGQRDYINAIRKNDVVFCIGPAGTGKTYLSVAMAISALKNEVVKKIVLARPAVEAGEKLGFLPGDVQAKVNPYLRPLYDALGNMMDTAQVKKFLENDLIEILPLAFMRGRTLNDSFVILDEAQNCTTKQMKTFLTRLGVRSKIVVTGDITQIDLPGDDESGLIDARNKLDKIPGIAFMHLHKSDIIRHRLVKDIVDAYEKTSGIEDKPAAEKRRAS